MKKSFVFGTVAALVLVTPSAVSASAAEIAAHPAPSCNGKAATIVVQPGVTTYGNYLANVIVGTPGDDVIYGDGNGDTICGMGGNDTIYGDSYDTTGNDWINGGDGNDTIDGQGGDDHLLGYVGHDDLDGGSGNDLVEAGVGNDELVGGTGGDTLLAGSGNDIVDAVAGGDWNTVDVVNAGADSDWVITNNGDSMDEGTAGSGFDYCQIDDAESYHAEIADCESFESPYQQMNTQLLLQSSQVQTTRQCLSNQESIVVNEHVVLCGGFVWNPRSEW